MRRKLVITGGGRERELQLVGRIVVGRDPGCEISHDDSLLSRRHAEFLTAADTVTVRDLGSRNGVFVNGARTVEQVLAPGDVVQIGPLRARVVADAAPAGTVPEEFDADRTAIIRKVFGASEANPGQPLVPAVATLDADDEDVTRMVPAPRMPAPASPSTDRFSSSAFDDGDAPTAFVPASEILTPPPAAPAGAPVSVASVSRTAIFFQVLALVMVALLSAVLPVWVGAAPFWLAVPLVIALAGSYLVSSSIYRQAGERRRT